MIHVNEQQDVKDKGPQSRKELYLLLREHIGHVVLVRHMDIERCGMLTRVSIRHNSDEAIFYSLDPGERIPVNLKQRVEVQLDGVWRVLSKGSLQNESL